MTPFESKAYFEGAARARDESLVSESYFVAAQMNMHTARGKSVRPSQLYRPQFATRKTFDSKDDFIDHMRREDED